MAVEKIKELQEIWENDIYRETLTMIPEKGITVADVQTVQKELQKRKRYLDITGNWLNHPNDFLAGIQAQVVFRSLTQE